MFKVFKLGAFRLTTGLVILALLFHAHMALSLLGDESAEGIAQIAKQLPYLNYSMTNGIWAQLVNGSASFIDDNAGLEGGNFGAKIPIHYERDESGVICHLSPSLSPYLRSAKLLERPIVFTDLDGDGRMDALVVILVVYAGIGYFDLFVVPVLMQPTGKAMVFPSSGYRVGETSVYALDSFDFVDNDTLRVAFMDRRPGEPKVIAPSVPTILMLSYDVGARTLGLHSRRVIASDCYASIFNATSTSE
ncbi:hypothetical protein MDAP_001550 [Mitosporidium daphniae]|uniref:Uncharacterized protein n=1 Tax=Mitosporidium daphniae TaxID=1485682 RepID=A0A098VMC7_9MICR|nr:uncharacterized protein DI09_9p70 [Mitosporidium daphniae]KGG49924.1 hypothetical protein DI09_9p70 [Mitosporidium daphniae]|eukprot:XP_013236389.1 uncharacterized protein DI09_9p70 [Mitosporidium daphniae]